MRSVTSSSSFFGIRLRPGFVQCPQCQHGGHSSRAANPNYTAPCTRRAVHHRRTRPAALASQTVTTGTSPPRLPWRLKKKKNDWSDVVTISYYHRQPLVPYPSGHWFIRGAYSTLRPLCGISRKTAALSLLIHCKNLAT